MYTRSLVRVPHWVPAPAGQICARSISSSPDSVDVLSLMSCGRSPAEAQASPPPRQSAPKLSPLRIAHQNLPTTRTQAQQMHEFAKTENYTKQMFRRWRPGDVYSPHDLSGVEQKKWKTSRTTPQSDAFDVLGINPVKEYKNYTIMSEYMTEMGRIKHAKQTGLRPVNQRKIAKAIRRAIGLGLMPSVHRHPLVLKKAGATRFI